MKFNDSFLYSRGVYWLFEIWQKDDKNILSKSKYDSFDNIIKCIGDDLDQSSIDSIKSKGHGLYVGKDGYKRFIKFVNLP